MKKFTLLACIILLGLHANAQDSSATINTSWTIYVADTSLTFLQITATCDSQFAAAGYPVYPSASPQGSDTAAADKDLDGTPFYTYSVWKNFYSTRLDFATGKPHSFATDALSMLTSGGSSTTNCAGTSALQSYIAAAAVPPVQAGWQFIGPQGSFAGSGGPSLNMHLGEVNGIIVNTATPTEIYATDKWGDLWATNNAPMPGTTGSPNWMCLSDNLPAMAGIGVTNLCVDFSASPHALYCLAGEYGNTYCLPIGVEDHLAHTIGIFYSLDNGTTFNQLNTSVIPNLLNNPILAMQLWPGNTATQKYLFVLTQFEIYRVNITNPAAPEWDSTISAYTIVPNDNITSRFWGFSGLNFLPADPTVMYVATNSNNGNSGFNAMGELFRMSSCSTCTSCSLTNIPISQTDYLQGEGSFTGNPFPNGPWYTSSFSVPTVTTTGTPTVTVTTAWNWHNEPGNYNVYCTPAPLSLGVCYTCGVSSAEVPVMGSFFDNVTYTISFTLTLPPYTEIDVVLKDVADANQFGADWGYNITPTLSSIPAYSVNFGVGPGFDYIEGTGTVTPTPGYYANLGATTQTVTVTNYPVTTTHFVDRLEFGAYQLGWYTSGNVTLSNVKIIEPYQNYIYSLITSPAIPECLFCCTSQATTVDTMRKIWDMGTGFPLISVGTVSGYSGNSTTSLQISGADTNIIYEFPSQSITTDVNKQDITTPSAPVNYTDGYAASALHSDSRSMFILPASGTDYLYIGDDGGIAYGPFGGPWQSLNGTGMKTSWGFDIGSSEHSGEVGEAATDNGIFTAMPANFSNWTVISPGDGAQVKFGKRYATRNVEFIGYSTSGVFQYLGTSYLGGLPSVNVLPSATPGVPSLGKLVTTYNGEYFGTGSDDNIYDMAISSGSGTTSDPYNFTFNSLTADPSFTASLPTVAPNGRGAVQAVAPDLYDANYIAAYMKMASWDQGYFAVCTTAASTTTAPTWTLISNSHSLPSGTAWESLICMVADPRSAASSKRLWAGANGYESTPGTNRVFQTTDGCNSWTDISYGLPSGPVNALAYDEQSHYLFAGTDQGIYAFNVDNVANGSSNPWQCYSLNFPNSFVTGLDINRCTGMIYASTYGRGGYEAALPPDPNAIGTGTGGYTDSCDIDYITASTIWTQDRDEVRSVYIPAGVTLTVQACTVNMGNGKAIIVAAGGHLIVNGATITNSCGAFWQGIQLKGSPGPYQQTAANDGWVTIENNGVIANAVVGVTNYNGSGGVVQATNSSFTDCNNDVTLSNYLYINSAGVVGVNLCYFYNCNFVLDGNYKGDKMGYPASYFVSLEGVEGVTFEGCNWLNRDPSIYEAGGDIGLYSVNGGFTVGGYCPGASSIVSGCPTSIPSRFCGFTNAIAMSGAGTGDYAVTSSIDNTIFDSSGIGINSSARNYVSMTEDTFNVGWGVAVEDISGTCFDNVGIYTQYDGPFKMEGNVFHGKSTGISSYADWTTIGTVVSNTDYIANTVYRNTFDSLTMGVYAIGSNPSLYIYCNAFKNNGDDIEVATDGSTGYQGIAPYQGIPFVSPAGNTFSGSANNIVNTVANSINYVYDNLNTADDPTTVSSHVNLLSVNANAACAPTIGLTTTGGNTRAYATVRIDQPTLQGYEQAFLASQQAWQDSLQSEHSRIDFGNTDSLVSYIDTVTDSCALYRTLIAGSPYLSRHAVASAANTLMLRNYSMVSVLKHNPDLLRDGNLTYYIDSIYTFTECEMTAMNNCANDSVTTRTVTEDSIMSYRAEMANDANIILMDLNAPGDTSVSVTDSTGPGICTDSTSIYYMLDSNTAYSNTDSVDAWLQHIGGLWTYYARVAYYNQLQQYTIADSIFNNIPRAVASLTAGTSLTTALTTAPTTAPYGTYLAYASYLAYDTLAVDTASISNIWNVVYNAETSTSLTRSAWSTTPARNIYTLDSADIAALDTFSTVVMPPSMATTLINNITNIINPSLGSGRIVGIPCIWLAHFGDRKGNKGGNNSSQSSLANPFSLMANNNQGSQQFAAFPNPASGVVTFAYNVPDAGGDVQIVITNVVGEEEATLHTGKNMGTVQWNPSALAPGMYIYQASGANGIICTGKIVVAR